MKGGRLVWNGRETLLPAGALVLLSGAPGSGKSTLAPRFIGATILSSDAIREELTGDAGNQDHNARVFAILNARRDEALIRGDVVVIDSTATRGRDRRPHREAARAFGRAAIALVVQVPEAVALERNRSRERRVPDHVIREYVRTIDAAARNGQFHQEGFDAVVVVDESARENLVVDPPGPAAPVPPLPWSYPCADPVDLLLPPVRVRGVAATALSRLLLSLGGTLADPSPVIASRLKPAESSAPVVRLDDLEQRRGVFVRGVDEREAAGPVAVFLAQTLPDIFVRPKPLGYRVEFSARTRERLDALRDAVVPTLPGHHLWRMDSLGDWLDRSESELDGSPARREALLNEMRAAVELAYAPGRVVTVEARGPWTEPSHPWRGVVQSFDGATLVLRRAFRASGRPHDGIDLPRQPGDYALVELGRGQRVARQQYHRADGTPIGEVWSLHTPAEFSPAGVHVIDLEVGVSSRPDRAPPARIEGLDELGERVARSEIAPEIARVAERTARELYQQAQGEG